MSRGQYTWTGLLHDVMLKLRAVQERMPSCLAFSGPTAGWIRGVDFAPCDPIEVTVPRDIAVRARAGVKVRRATLPDADVTVLRGLRVTSALRTVCDLGSRRNLTDSVIAVDIPLHARLVDMDDWSRFLLANPGSKGIKRLRRAVGLADRGAASPMGTRLRLELVLARLPRPRTQSKLFDGAGRFIARADLYYPDRRLVIEYDGENHKERLVPDLRRQNALVNAGFHLLRFTASDLHTPGSVAAQVRRAREILPRNIG
jgi:hypothetical protein